MAEPAAPRSGGPDCHACRAFYVSHDPLRPYGCRAFGFHSRLLPRDEVRLSSGRECAAFEPRASASGTHPPRPSR
jgi:hypothetical protein